MIHSADKKYNIPIIAHIDMNAKIKYLKTFNKYLELKAWNRYQDDNYS